MKINYNQLKPAIFQGLLIFVFGNALTIVFMEGKYIGATLIYIGSLALIRVAAVYRHKKKTIEDERLLDSRKKAQSIWFMVSLGLMGLLPYLIIFYARYIHNPIITTLGNSTIELETLGYGMLYPLLMVVFFLVMGSEVTVRLIMRSHEK